VVPVRWSNDLVDDAGVAPVSELLEQAADDGLVFFGGAAEGQCGVVIYR
jgi:hypothetical protein